MKAKKIMILISVVCALAIPITVFAATSDVPLAKAVRGACGIDYSKLTDKQKVDVKDYSSKMASTQKDFINKMIENGSITKEQGKLEIDRVDKALKDGNYVPYFGSGKMKGQAKRNPLGIDATKLTTQQKADFKAIYTKIATAQKDYLNKQVANSLITKAQADTCIARIDERMASENFYGKFTGRVGWLGVDESKLTTQQKSDMDAYAKQIKDLQNELVNKAVANGALTKEQGDIALERIKNMGTNNFKAGKGMMDGMGRGRGQGNGMGKGLKN